jgi:hypothetical protein
LKLKIEPGGEPKKNFDPRKFRGVIQNDKAKIEKEMEDLREEWDREY